MKKNFLISFIVTVLVISAVLIYHSHISFVKDAQQRYSILAKKLHLETKTLVEQKKEATLLLALSLSKDNRVKEALKKKDSSNLTLKDITDTYTTYTTFKNVWIHLITSDGISFLKSWTQRKGESILDIRKDVVSFLKAPRVKTHVSVGKYDMTVKAMVPIYEGTKLLGLFEVITKVNSIAKNLSKEGVVPIVLVDKKYKKQLRHAYTNTFVNDYYVANLEVNPTILQFTRDLNLEDILHKKSEYQIVENKFLTIYHLKDVHNENMGYFLLYKDLEQISIADLRSKHIIFVLVWLGLVSILVFVFFYTINKTYTNNLQKEIEEKTKKLKEINENLQQLIEIETEKNRRNEIKLFQQEKLLHIAQMFQNIAHHWRQPLSIITTNLSGLRLRFDYEEVSQKEIVSVIDQAMDKAEELSSNIEFFSKSYNNDETSEKLQLQDMCDNAIKVLRPILKKEDIQVAKKYTVEPLFVSYNKSKFINMIVTILTNSCESLVLSDSKKRNIHIRLYKEDDMSVISIEDNGTGIDEKIINKIFEPYVTIKHQSSGIGLSLYFAHNIITYELKGSIEAYNTQEGANILIKLPMDNLDG